MKTKLLFIFAFLLVFSWPVFSQDEKKDYLNFDSRGQLVSFKKTFPSGAYFESTGELEGTNPSYTKIYFRFADGDELFSAFYHLHISITYFYQVCEKRPQMFDSFQAFGLGLMELQERGEDGKSLIYVNPIMGQSPSVLIAPNGTKCYVAFYEHKLPELYKIWLPINDNGDFLFCNVPDEWAGDINELELIQLRKTFDNCVLEFSVSQWRKPMNRKRIVEEVTGEISYTNKSTYSGTFMIDDIFNDTEYWDGLDGELPSTIRYKNGVLTTADKECKAYVDGEYSEFESIRITQMNEKKAAEEKAREEAVREAQAALNKQYGEEYVNAMLKGELILGTPEKLFLLGMEIHAYSSFTKAERFYTSKKMSIYDVYGWRIDTNRTIAITNSALLGTLRFENGVLVSMFE